MARFLVSRRCLSQSVVLSVLALTACSAGGGKAPTGTSQNVTAGAGSGGSGSLFDNGAGGGTTAPDLVVGSPGTVGSGTSPDAACEAVVQKAEKRAGGRADIVFTLDNSGSMTEEAAAVQNNMNAFSKLIAGSGIDAHVVVISSGPPAAAPSCTSPLDPQCLGGGFRRGGGNGVCIDPPLGLSGACPAGDDTNFPGYMHWRQEVGSHNLLALIQSTYDNWKGMLRADAAKTFVVVTDDENTPAPTGPEFATWVNAQPLFQSALWRFSGIFCLAASANCSGAGATYQALVSQTGGIVGDMGQFSAGQGQIDAQFQTVFTSLAQAIVKDSVPVACEWSIPPPPEGKTFDPDAVNVRYTSGKGVTDTLFGVGSAAECTDQYGGWFYDDPTHPTRVVACPQSCKTIQADDSARIDVLFGCARERPPIR
jgi:hypothetical protein